MSSPPTERLEAWLSPIYNTQTWQLWAAFYSIKITIKTDKMWMWLLSGARPFFVKRNDIHILENVEQISSVNQLCCWLESVTLRQLSVQACHSHRKRGEVALQSASDGQSNLLPLTLTQDTTVSLPIATNMLSLAVGTFKFWKIAHTARDTNVLVCKLTPSVQRRTYSHSHH